MEPPAPGSLSILRIAFDAMYYANRAYGATEEAQVALMDELDRTMTYLSGCTRTGRHWGCGLWSAAQQLGRRNDTDTYISRYRIQPVFIRQYKALPE
jgi:hypothetical protein